MSRSNDWFGAFNFVSAASLWAASRFDARQTTSIIASKAFFLLGMDQRLIRWDLWCWLYNKLFTCWRTNIHWQLIWIRLHVKIESVSVWVWLGFNIVAALKAISKPCCLFTGSVVNCEPILNAWTVAAWIVLCFVLSITKLADINYKLHLTRPKNFVMYLVVTTCMLLNT